MKLKSEFKEIFKNLEQDAAYKDIKNILSKQDQKGGAQLNIVGPAESQKIFCCVALCSELGVKPVIFAADDAKGQTIKKSFENFYLDDVLFFPARQINLVETEAASRELEYQRIQTLTRLMQDNYDALVITAAAAVQLLMDAAKFKTLQFKIEVGMAIEPQQLCQFLSAYGYEHTDLVENTGQYAHRGDIVDVGVLGEEERQALRISFFDTEIDSIRIMNMDSQRSEEMKNAYKIGTAREILLAEDEGLALAAKIKKIKVQSEQDAIRDNISEEIRERRKQFLENDILRLETNIHFNGMDRWISYIYPERNSILDYLHLSKCKIFLDEPNRILKAVESIQAVQWTEMKMLLEKGQVVAQNFENQLSSQEFIAKIKQAKNLVGLIELQEPQDDFNFAKLKNIYAQPVEHYHGREQELFQDLKRWQQKDIKVLFFTGSENKQAHLKTLLEQQNLSVEYISDAALKTGFIWEEAKLVVLGVFDLFGLEKTKRKKLKSQKKLDFFSDVVKGDLVVHESHGIARYEGLINIETSGGKRDYLHLLYAGNDALYLPLDSLDQLKKYMAVHGKKVKLSKLGGHEWEKLRERAEHSIKQLATDLLALYAKRQKIKGYKFSKDTVWQAEFEDAFPYEETEDQIQSLQEIKADMESTKVMDRLLCGDVGFGKTEVALRACFKAVMDGKQAVMLVPTTILAQQHYETFLERCQNFPVSIALLNRFVAKEQQKEIKRQVKHGEIDVLIGTHRILSKDIEFQDLGFLVIDEEQRFGIDHKEKIKEKNSAVDVLTLSATPIPRTLHMSMSGIRDISTLREGPEERRPVQTYVIAYEDMIIVEAILREIRRQGQVFYLFNNTHKILEKAAHLKQLMPQARIAVAHGKMTEHHLEKIIENFVQQKVDVLVCTTIIESGIDMPNVNTIIVENADKMGLSQLYQLKGRVGRSKRQAYAYITYHKEKVLTEIAEKRLAAIRDFTELGSGFKIALRDLEVRGAGNLLGAEQHGHMEAIGYDLYCRLLEEAVLEAQGDIKEEILPHTTIELSVDAYLSRSYIEDDGQRMYMYRRIETIKNISDYQDVMDELMDRFGDLPVTAQNIVDISYIRMAATKAGMELVTEKGQDVMMKYSLKQKPNMEYLAKMLAIPEVKGSLLFNAGSRPYIIYRQAAVDKSSLCQKLRKLFMNIE